MKIKSYLSFNGNAEEALGFYAGVLNGTISEIYRYEGFDDIPVPDSYKNKVAHAELIFGDCSIYIADSHPDVKTDFGTYGHVLTLIFDNEQEIRDVFEKLSVGGHIRCELCQSSFAQLYAEVTDCYGVSWGLIIECSE